MGFLGSIAALKKARYEDLKMNYPYALKWKWYSYRALKIKIYVEISSVIAFFCIKWRVKPNYITAVYALLGISGGVLLAVPSRAAICVAVFLYYFRGALDWADGLVARELKASSLDGAIFDSYGANVGWIALWAGAGIYLGNYTNGVFFYLAPLIPAILAGDLCASARETLIYHGFLKKTANSNEVKAVNDSAAKQQESRSRKIKKFIDEVFEHNTRTVDIVVLTILLETASGIRIFWIYYTAFLVWLIIRFIARFAMLTTGKWAKDEIDRLRKAIYD